jgi:hypothetical protein
MAADELMAEARIVTLEAERERVLAAVRSVEAALARVQAGPAVRTWPRAFARGLAWGVVIGAVTAIVSVLRMMGC